jgi:multidrug transporter EmrE-like cation transporter
MTGFPGLTVIIATIMSGVDKVMESTEKLYNSNNKLMYIIGAMVIYSFQPILFSYNMTLTSMGMVETNILWNVLSTLLVTFVGLYYFNEKVEYHTMMGIILGILSIVFLNYTSISLLLYSPSSSISSSSSLSL